MKNQARWHPTKYVLAGGRLRASRDRRFVGAGSWLFADLIARAYESALPEYCQGRLLDLGCAEVPLFQAYQALVTENICVDWPESVHRREFLDYEADLTAPLPLDDERFDTVILSDVLEHIPEPAALCSEITRVLAPGGHLIMNVPFLYWLHELPHDYYRYTEFALRRLLVQSGLEVRVLYPLGGAPEVLADLTAKNALLVPRVGGAIASAIQHLAALVVRSRLGKRVSQRTAKAFPLGYFLVAQKPSS